MTPRSTAQNASLRRAGLVIPFEEFGSLGAGACGDSESGEAEEVLDDLEDSRPRTEFHVQMRLTTKAIKSRMATGTNQELGRITPYPLREGTLRLPLAIAARMTSAFRWRTKGGSCRARR